MPYISKEKRAALAFFGASDAGELNYFFSYIMDHYLASSGLNYQHINDCIGALEGAKLELYRRVVVPYEEKKLAENGDVYSSQTLGEGQ